MCPIDLRPMFENLGIKKSHYPAEIVRWVEWDHLNLDVYNYILSHWLTDDVIEWLCFQGFSPSINALVCDPE